MPGSRHIAWPGGGQTTCRHDDGWRGHDPSTPPDGELLAEGASRKEDIEDVIAYPADLLDVGERNDLCSGSSPR
jgi:hypothetical protein